MRRVRLIVAFIVIPVATSAFLGLGQLAHGSTVCPPPKDPGPIPVTNRGPAYFTPQVQSIHLKYGEKKIVPMNLIRPASNSKVDVFFLIDATDSMDFAICAVQRAVTSTAITLAKTGLDAQFGLASFRDYPYHPWGQPKDDPPGYEGDYVYRLEAPIAPLDFYFLDALHGIRAAGGGDLPEAGQAALYQALSGAGQEIHPGQQSPGDIPPGAGANFRPDALHLIIMSTDAEFVEPSPDNVSSDGSNLTYPGPPWRWVKSWLRKTNTKVASLLLGDDARDSLTKAAVDSGAFAPKGGAQCSATVFIPEGQPLVCDATNYGDDPGNFSVGPAITGIVQALQDIRPLSYQLSGDTDMIGALPSGGETIDFKHDATVPFALTLVCKDHSGSKHVYVTAKSGSDTLANAAINVLCDPKPPDDAGLTITLLRGAAIAPAAQQPAPASNLNPQAAMGMVSQNEQQTAYQHSSNDQDPMQMEMTAMPRKRANGISPFAVGVAIITGAAAFGLSRKQQAALAKAKINARVKH
ncbi:MAG: hypothetical protein ACYDCC_16025 [Actinomycetota bacterium]